MKDITRALRKKYFELLNGNLTIDSNSVPVYYKYIPNTISTPYYVVIRTAGNTDDSTMQSRKTNTSIQLAIYTKDTTANDGNAADEISEQIKNIILPNLTNNTMDLEPYFQVIVLLLENDYSPDALQMNNAIFINRFLTFSHIIMHRQTA